MGLALRRGACGAGAAILNDAETKTGNGVAVTTSGALTLEGADNAEVLLFDMGP